MSGQYLLNADAQQFFSLLSKVIFTNPFSVAPSEVEQLLGAEVREPVEHVFTVLSPVVDERLSQLASQGVRNSKTFTLIISCWFAMRFYFRSTIVTSMNLID